MILAAMQHNIVHIPVLYGCDAVLSFCLLLGCIALVRKNRVWFMLLFSSVLIVNVGYTLLSFAPNLTMALCWNSLAYLGSVFLPLSMFMIILNVTNTPYPRKLTVGLIGLSIVMFLIAASPGILPIYYQEVSLQIENEVSSLIKVYGPLHPLYLVYLLGYFSAMVVVILRSWRKKQIDTPAHAIILAIAVLGNIGVWSMEQFSTLNFEFLSVSYIITELFLLGVHLVVKENQRLKDLVRQKEKEVREANAKQVGNSEFSKDMIEDFRNGLSLLTPTERTIYEAYVAGASTKDILEKLSIKENTLKYHNKNIYGKLGVSSRKQLIAVAKATCL